MVSGSPSCQVMPWSNAKSQVMVVESSLTVQSVTIKGSTSPSAPVCQNGAVTKEL